jgi:hypothetical protein
MYKGKWTGEVKVGKETMVTTSKAAKLLSKSVATVRNECDDGRIPCVRHPKGHRLIPLSYIQSQLKRG